MCLQFEQEYDHIVDSLESEISIALRDMTDASAVLANDIILPRGGRGFVYGLQVNVAAHPMHDTTHASMQGTPDCPRTAQLRRRALQLGQLTSHLLSSSQAKGATTLRLCKAVVFGVWAFVPSDEKDVRPVSDCRPRASPFELATDASLSLIAP